MFNKADFIADLRFSPQLRNDVPTYQCKYGIYAVELETGPNFFTARVPRAPCSTYPQGNIGHCGDILRVGKNAHGKLTNFRLADAVSGSVNGAAMARLMVRDEVAEILQTNLDEKKVRTKIIEIQKALQTLFPADEIRSIWVQEILSKPELFSNYDELNKLIKSIGYRLSSDKLAFIFDPNLRSQSLSNTTFLAGYIEGYGLHIIRVGDPELIIVNRDSREIRTLPFAHTGQWVDRIYAPAQLAINGHTITEGKIEYRTEVLRKRDIVLAITDGIAYHSAVNGYKEEFAREIASYVADELEKNPDMLLEELGLELVGKAAGYDDCGLIAIDVE